VNYILFTFSYAKKIKGLGKLSIEKPPAARAQDAR